MFNVIENTPQRLVIELGTKVAHSTTFILNKGTGEARFERKVFLVRRRPVDVKLHEIAGLDPVVTRSRGYTTFSIVLRLRTGKRRWLSGGPDEPSTYEAARQMRAFLGLPEPDAAAAAKAVPGFYRWSLRGLTAASFVVGGLIVVGQVLESTTLPDCTSDTARDTLFEIFKEAADLEVTGFASARQVGIRADEGKLCRAIIEAEDERLPIDYAVFWDGWSPSIQFIGAIEDAIEDAKIADVRQASEDFLALAGSGDALPRETDAEVKALLDRVFDTSSFDFLVLPEPDVDDAVAWFNAGHEIGVVYILAGTGYTDFASVPDEPEVEAHRQRNVAEFAPEVGRYLDFEVRLLDALARAELARMTFTSGVVAASSDDEARVELFRAFLLAAMQTSLAYASYDDLPDEWRISRIEQVAGAIDTAKALLLPEQATALREQALLVAEQFGDRPVKALLTSVADRIGES